MRLPACEQRAFMVGHQKGRNSQNFGRGQDGGWASKMAYAIVIEGQQWAAVAKRLRDHEMRRADALDVDSDLLDVLMKS